MRATQPEGYTPSQYTHLANAYNRSEFPSIRKMLRSLAASTGLNTRYPILKLLKAVCRRLLINEFESIFFAYVVQTNRWNIHDEIIRREAEEVRDIVCYPTEDEDYKCVILYLLLCGYTVKYYLNEEPDMFAIESEKVCPEFRRIFQEWAKQYAQTTLKINPKSLNKVYRQIYLQQESAKVQADYNALVDQLLQISPSYNPQKQKGETASSLKKELVSEYRQVKKEHHHHHHPLNSSMYSNLHQPTTPQMSASLINLTILSSSGFLHQINPSLAVVNNNTNSSNLISTSGAFLKRRQVNLGSSFFGLQDNTVGNVQDEVADIRDVTLGLQTVESDCEEMPAVPARKQPPKQEEVGTPQPMGFSLTRNISNTSDYLFHG